MNELYLYGEIGYTPGCTAEDVVQYLNRATGDVVVHIASGGGDVYEGIGIMNALRAHDGEVTAVVESIAASAASFIAVGGADRVVMRPNAEMMIHRAWTMFTGNADDVEKHLANLQRQDEKLARIYQEKAGGELEAWLDAMAAETWFTAEEAVAAGLADAVEDTKQLAKAPAASLYAASMRRFKYAGRGEAPPPRLSAAVDTDKKGDTMNVLETLANELGKTTAEVRNALSGFFNETVETRSEIEVTYPDATIAPTERIVVEPVVAGADTPVESLGLSFVIGAVADGFTAEVDAAGVVTITAPAGVEVGQTAAFTVLVNDVEVPLQVVVKSLADDDDEADAAEETQELEHTTGESVTLDAETYAELRAAAQFGWKAMEADKRAQLVAEVDTWIAEGRISAGLRTKAIDAIQRDAAAARDIYGSNPKNTIPRTAVGSAKAPALEETAPDGGFPAKADLLKLAAQRRAGN